MKLFYSFLSASLLALLLLPLCSTAQTYRAALTGRSQPAPVATTAFGDVIATLDGNTLTVAGGFEGLSSPLATEIAGGAHIHLGYAGQSGGVEVVLNTTLSEDGTAGTFDSENNIFELTDVQLAALTNRQLYINVHSANFASGEIRGQLLPESDAFYASNLFGSYEVPVVMTAASGSAVIEVRGDEMIVTGSFSGLEGDFAADVAGGAHIHLAMAGQNGGIEFPLTTNVSDDLRSGVFEAADNTFSITEDQLSALEGRRLYFNIHTEKARSGEIRGQIVSNSALTVFRAHLSGGYEVPITTTTATGMVLAEVLAEGQIQVSGTFNGLESDLATDIVGGAHLHGGMAGMTGGVIVPLESNTEDNRTGTFPAGSNAFDFSEEIARLYNRGVYVNIHSQNVRSGELRGQLLPERPINFNGFLSGIFEVPEAVTSALGAVKAELNGNQLTVSGSFAGLNSPLATNIAGGAHIHLGYAGQTGGIEFLLTTTSSEDGLDGVFEAAQNTFELTDEQIAQIRGRQLYVNIHSENIASGELRSQFLFEANSYFVAPLSGASQNPPVDTDAIGMVVVEVNGSNGFATGSFAGLAGDLATDIVGGVHFHTALAGANGPVRELLNTTLADDNRSGVFTAGQNTFPIESGLLDTIRNRMVYVNVHSTESRSGEIRGQVLPLATTYFTTTLSGANEVPALATPASGAMKFELVGNILTASGRFDDLQGTFAADIAGGAHIHLAPVGENGGVEILLTTALDEDQLGGSYEASENTFELTDDQVAALRSGNFYVNIHSEFSRSGELRGQILPEINRFPQGTVAITAPANGAAVTIEGDGETPFVPTWSPAMDRDMLSYTWQLAADEGFSTIVFQTNIADTALVADFATVDALLEGAGVEVGQTITLFHRAIASDGALQLVGEGASVVLTRGVIGAAEGIDLEMSITASSETNSIFTNTTFEIVVSNTGTEEATNIRMVAGRPEGMVHTSADVTNGIYRLVIERWDIESLPAGQSDTLFLTLFSLVDDVDFVNFVQVESVDQTDVDSTPNNNDTTTPAEDDEAVVTVMSASANANRLNLATSSVRVNRLYPNPASDVITLDINAMQSSNSMIQIFSASGQLVQAQRIDLFEGFNQAQFNISELPSGNYFLRVEGMEVNVSFVK